MDYSECNSYVIKSNNAKGFVILDSEDKANNISALLIVIISISVISGFIFIRKKKEK